MEDGQLEDHLEEGITLRCF